MFEGAAAGALTPHTAALLTDTFHRTRSGMALRLGIFL